MQDELQDRIEKIKAEIEKLKETQEYLAKILREFQVIDSKTEITFNDVNVPKTPKGGPANEDVL